jgi:DNA (cytosine-5)-methyltransferase 1
VPEVEWGKYEEAVRRWEGVLGRPAPSPTEPNSKGNPRLAPAFAEFMMGWPEGWVTDPAIGLTRNDQLKAIGNGVVPHQAIAALRSLLPHAGIKVGNDEL